MSYDQDGTAGVGTLGIVSETDRETRRAAALTCARQAKDAEDLAELLAMLGLLADGRAVA
jgi:hypothetical protein